MVSIWVLYGLVLKLIRFHMELVWSHMDLVWVSYESHTFLYDLIRSHMVFTPSHCTQEHTLLDHEFERKGYKASHFIVESQQHITSHTPLAFS